MGESIMNRFEWYSVLSDHLDGKLRGHQKAEATRFLKNAPEAATRLERYQRIVETIAARPKSTLSDPVKKEPLSTAHLVSQEGKKRSNRWERTPWFIRSGVEGVGIAALILVVVAMLPKLRGLYERNLERRFDSFNMAELALDTPTINPQVIDVGTLDQKTLRERVERDSLVAGNENIGGDANPDEFREQIEVGNSEVWRFTIKTDSPKELRKRIINTLKGYKLTGKVEGIEGVRAPGGVQFQLILPQEIIGDLKRRIETIALSSATASADEDTFTWYRLTRQRRVPKGKTKVVIWLSQI